MGFSSGRFSLSAGLVTILILAALSGCASKPARTAHSPVTQVEGRLVEHPGARIAAAQVGAPYRYGGASPHGFDCSGLVYYAYRKAGFRVPRTTHAQLRKATRIPPDRLRPGDLVFFKLDRHPVSHVGIYTGNNRFVHAPSSGKRVTFTALNDPYWRTRLVAAGRYF